MDREAAQSDWQRLEADIHKAEADLHRSVAAASPILPRDGNYRRLPTLLAALQNDLTEPYVGQLAAPWPHDQRSRPAQVRPELTIKARYLPEVMQQWIHENLVSDPLVQEAHTLLVYADDRDMNRVDYWPGVARMATERSRVTAGKITRPVMCQLGPASGTEGCHPTWARVFCLMHLAATFPGKHLISMDSDCAVTSLYETSDLWQLLSAAKVGANGVDTNDPHFDAKPGVLLVTDRRHPTNAGIVWVAAAQELTPKQFRAPAEALQIIDQRRLRLIQADQLRAIAPGGATTVAEEWEAAWRRTAWAAMPYKVAQAQMPLDFLVMWTDVGQLMCAQGFEGVAVTSPGSTPGEERRHITPGSTWSLQG